MNASDSHAATLPAPAELLPHDAPMVLIDELLSWDGRFAVTKVVLRADFPLVNDHKIPGHFCIELMAQAVGCAAGMLARERGETDRPPVGFILGGRELNFYRPTLMVGETLMIEALHIFGDDKLGSFRSRVLVAGEVIADATLNVYAGRRLEELP